MLTIGKVAKCANVNLETIRYYERIGLLPETERSESGYRQYSKDMVQKIKFIKHAQKLGFSLKEIQELLRLKVDPQVSCGDIKQKAEDKISDVEKKIRSLKSIKNVLLELTQACSGVGPIKECPILDALEQVDDSTL